MSTLRARCPECRTLTAVAVDDGYECHACARAFSAGLVRACHDLSEGGLAVAIAEMAFAGGLGARLDLSRVPHDGKLGDHALLFAESNSRFLLEVAPERLDAVRAALAGVPFAVVGEVLEERIVRILDRDGAEVVREPIEVLESAWRGTLAW